MSEPASGHSQFKSRLGGPMFNIGWRVTARTIVCIALAAGSPSVADAKIVADSDSGTRFKTLLASTLSRIQDSLGNDCLKSTEAPTMLNFVKADDGHTVTVVLF